MYLYDNTYKVIYTEKNLIKWYYYFIHFYKMIKTRKSIPSTAEVYNGQVYINFDINLF